MAREEDTFWQHVTILKHCSHRNKRWKCNFCTLERTGKVTMVKKHLGHVGKGITYCPNVDDSIKEEAEEALGKHEVVNGELTGVTADSSNQSGQHTPETENNPSKRPIRTRERNQSKRQRPVEASIAGDMPPQPDGTVTSLAAANQIVIAMMAKDASRPPQAQPSSIIEEDPDIELRGSSSALPQELLTTTDEGTIAPVIGQTSHLHNGLQEKMDTLEIKLADLSSKVRGLSEKVERIKNEVRRIRHEWSVSREWHSFQLETQVEELTTEVDELLPYSRPLTLREQRARGEAFLLSDPVDGHNFESYINKIRNHLNRDHISRIGIYGMGGVGKTRLAMHLYNILYDDKSVENVIWVHVPRDISIHDLQTEIAKALLVPGLLKESVEKKRAKVLREYLSEMRKSVLILDDVWDHFEPEEAGIPIRSDGLKLVLTTRSLSICHKMLCQEKIKVEALSAFGAFSLFEQHFGPDSLPSKLEDISAGIIHICGGLPLAIIEMAKSMRAWTQAYAWEVALRKLKDGRQEDMVKKVFPILKRSYDCLPLQVQQCLLRCALYAKRCPGDGFLTLDLIEVLVDAGLISGSPDLQMMYKEGNSILEELINACLLEHYREGRFLWMHPLIVDMAFDIMSTTSPAKVIRSRMRLEDIVNEGHLSSDLHMVYMSYIKGAAQDNMSLDCPKLSILLIVDSYKLDKIPECFFMHLVQLKVLNLSRSNLQKIPSSISDLIHLRALVLRRCEQLTHIPSVAKMRSLTKLDLSLCRALEAEPDGLENLIGLKYLDLFGTKIYGLCDRLLHQLVKIQYLGFNYSNDSGRGACLSSLKKLEYLKCSFWDAMELLMFRNSNPDLPSLYYFSIQYGKYADDDDRDDDDDYDIDDDVDAQMFKLRLEDTSHYGNLIQIQGRMGIEIGDRIYLPADVQILSIGYFVVAERVSLFPRHVLSPQSNLKELTVRGCWKLKYLFTASASCYLPNLEVLKIKSCNDLEGIVAPGSPLPVGAFPSLKSICVKRCRKLKTLAGHLLLPHLKKLSKIDVRNCFNLEIEWNLAMPSYHAEGSFCLREIHVVGCHSIRILLPAELLPHLTHLQTIYACNCMQMEEVIGNALGRSSQSCSRLPLPFPQLRSLTLLSLRTLERICDRPLDCGSFSEITAVECPLLKTIPLHLPSGADGRTLPPPYLDKIVVDTKARWESLEWPEQPEAKTLLEPFIEFYSF